MAERVRERQAAGLADAQPVAALVFRRQENARPHSSDDGEEHPPKLVERQLVNTSPYGSDDDIEHPPTLVERKPVNTSRMLRGSAPVTQRPRARVVHTQ